MEPRDLAQLLNAHGLWLSSDGKEGRRAIGTYDFSENDLRGAELSKALLRNSNFTKANLRDANLKEARLTRAVFEHADLQNAILHNARLIEANFTEALLTSADFQGAVLRRASFKRAKLGGQTRLREADLRNADLAQALYLQTAQLAGANVGGAKLPKAIAEFEGLKTIAKATSNAQKLFIAVLGGCVYSWLTIATTKDAALLTNSVSSPLPVIATPLPIVGFYYVAPVLLLALYFYFHLNMQRLWEALADLPAVFPDGRPLDKRADPWLLNVLVRAHFVRLRSDKPPLSWLQKWISIILGWWLVPVTLLAFWSYFLRRHDWVGTGLHVVLFTASLAGACIFYRLARGTLRGEPRKPFIWRHPWRDLRTYKGIAAVLGVCAFGVIFYLISASAIQGIPRYFYAGEVLWTSEGSKGPDPTVGAYSLRRLLPRTLEYIGASPFADLRRQDISTKPPNWTGDAKEYALVKGAHLREANMQYADASRAFLVNADMSAARLSNADLSYANLANADLSYANLTNADLSCANLTNADLSHTNLSGANLVEAHLNGVDLRNAKGLSKSQLNKAVTDEHTLLPVRLPP